MFILTGFRKNGDHKNIAIHPDKEVLKELAKSLNHAANHDDPSEGLWDREEIKGSFFIEEIDDTIDAAYQRGLDFINYND